MVAAGLSKRFRQSAALAARSRSLVSRPEPRVPSVPVFDAHFHIIDRRFPLVPNQGYVPDPFPLDSYLERMRRYNLIGGAVVSGSFQAFDQGHLLSSLRKLGPRFVGVTQVPPSITDEAIARLDAAGVRAIRFNLHRGSAATLPEIDALARHVFAVAKWHSEFYVEARHLPALLPTLRKLPAVCIDHLGVTMEGLDSLVELVDGGAYVKASGFGRMTTPPWSVPRVLSRLHAANPAALVFGTDLPSPRAPRPFQDGDSLLLWEILHEEGARRVLGTNALALYRFK
jgi:predicted TIM-barrel fold metal-dependent hydrolase